MLMYVLLGTFGPQRVGREQLRGMSILLLLVRSWLPRQRNETNRRGDPIPLILRAALSSREKQQYLKATAVGSARKSIVSLGGFGLF